MGLSLPSPPAHPCPLFACKQYEQGASVLIVNIASRTEIPALMFARKQLAEMSGLGGAKPRVGPEHDGKKHLSPRA